MVTAGYAATVAPLGTALTENQLALLWKMADEPILCFDGDAAGRRAGRMKQTTPRCPISSPAGVLRFASLPDGHDPDDLVRSGGPGAIAEHPRRCPSARRRAVGAGSGGWAVRYAGASRRPRSAHQRACNCDRRRDGSPLLSRGFAAAPARSDGARGPRTWARSGQGAAAAVAWPRRATGGDDARADRTAFPAAAGLLDRARLTQRRADARSAHPALGLQSPVAPRYRGRASR